MGILNEIKAGQHGLIFSSSLKLLTRLFTIFAQISRHPADSFLDRNSVQWHYKTWNNKTHIHDSHGFNSPQHEYTYLTIWIRYRHWAVTPMSPLSKHRYCNKREMDRYKPLQWYKSHSNIVQPIYLNNFYCRWNFISSLLHQQILGPSFDSLCVGLGLMFIWRKSQRRRRRNRRASTTTIR